MFLFVDLFGLGIPGIIGDVIAGGFHLESLSHASLFLLVDFDLPGFGGVVVVVVFGVFQLELVSYRGVVEIGVEDGLVFPILSLLLLVLLNEFWLCISLDS